MNATNAYFVVGKLFKRLFDRFHRAGHIRFNDQVQCLQLAFGHLTEQIVQRHFLLLLNLRCLDPITPFFRYLTVELVIVCRKEHIARIRNFVKAEYFHRGRRSRSIHNAALIVHHCANSAISRTSHDCIALMQRTVLNQNRSYRASCFIKLRFDNRSFRKAVRIGAKLENIRLEQYHLQ